MSKSDAFENALLLLIFNATTIANLADNAASSPATSLTFALHTADPGEAGDMTTSECTYGSYARATVTRNGSGFTVSGNAVSLASALAFPQATSGSETATYWSVGTGVSDNVLYRGAISGGGIPITTGTIPQLAAGTVITED